MSNKSSICALHSDFIVAMVGVCVVVVKVVVVAGFVSNSPGHRQNSGRLLWQL